jgi:hypothetical protein
MQVTCDTVLADLDGTPHPCGASLTDERKYPDEWDRNTAIVDGAEVVVEYHVGLFCEQCGTQTVVSRPLERPAPFAGH